MSSNIPLRFFIAGLFAFSWIGSAFSQTPSIDAKLCKTLPVEEIEAVVGAKLLRKSGVDAAEFNSCTAFFGSGGVMVKVERRSPGQEGLPPDVKAGLTGISTIFGSAFKGLKTKDFGEIGCYQGTFEAGGGVKTTVCFQPKGYYSLTIGGLSEFLPMETVKGLLEKLMAASR